MIGSAIYDRLSTTAELTEKLAWLKDDWGNEYPAIFQIWAAQDSPFPYIVFRLEENSSFDHVYKSEFTLHLDVWDYNEGGSVITATEISDIIKKMFHNVSVVHPKYGAMTSWFSVRGQIQEETEGIVHIIHQFTIQAWTREVI